jgi:predicted RND superfamily exporter protein
LNDEFVKYFDDSVQFRIDTDFTTSNLTGIYNIAYSLESGESGGISEPGYLNKLEEFADWFREQPEVLHVNSLSDTMKRLNQNLHADQPEWYRIPQRRELAAQYLLLYEMSLPYGLDLNNQINVDKSASKLDVSLRSVSSNSVIALEERAQQWLNENAPPSMQVNGASPAIMFSHIGARNIRSMLGGTTVALLLISFTLVFALRSLRIGLISIIPNLVPAGMAFGLWGLLVGQVGLALSVVTGMTLGIVVDDTVHFLSKYLRARREKSLSSADAVRYAFHTVGTALWTTSMVLIAGFLVLTGSPFELNSGMGLLTAITIGLALLADFLLLPTLLMALDKKEDYVSTLVADPAESVV